MFSISFLQYCHKTYFETESKVNGGAFLPKYVTTSEMYLISEMYLERSQKYAGALLLFCKNSQKFLAGNSFCKKAPS